MFRNYQEPWNGFRPCSGIGCSYYTSFTDCHAAIHVFCSRACEEALKDELYSVSRGEVCSAPECTRGCYPRHLNTRDALSFLIQTRKNPTWYRYCSERCSNWKQLEHRHTPLGMARSYMHWLRHHNHDDDHYLSNHRVDTIRRTHPCGCNECVSARNSGQLDQDQLILELENTWFNQDENKVFNHGYFLKHPTDECEFSGATETATATGQHAQAGFSSAGTGAGCSAVMTTNASEEAECLGFAAARTTGQEAQAGVSIAGTGAGCSTVMTTCCASDEAECSDLASSTGAGKCSAMTTQK